MTVNVTQDDAFPHIRNSLFRPSAGQGCTAMVRLFAGFVR